MASSQANSISPQSLITEDHVKKVLETDKGSDAHLKSWKVVDFTTPGDNYGSVVTCVEVLFSKDNEDDCEVTYVVKLNPLKKIEGFPDLIPYYFSKEGKFYEEIVPALNERLISSGQKPLGFPKCFLVSLEDGKEQIYLEDLRARDFKMFDRRKGLDEDHVALVLAEVARLHAASYLLKKRVLNGAPAAEKYEFLSRDLLNFCPNGKEVFVPLFHSNIDTGIMMLEKVGGYETAINWLKSFKPEVETVLSTLMQSETFNTICHGDCWNNNILFRYDSEGRPIEVMLIDLQACREASLACDLNYFLYTSVTGDVRRPNIDHFLSIYHSTYKAVLESDGIPMYFNEEELLEEFRGKNKVGLIFALSVIPALLMEPSEIPGMEDKDIETLMQEMRMIALDKLKTNPLCKPRYLSLFDEFMETGLIS
ncbi:uncharacterized protein [Palaemon carinicauda]|uniref:uncharacterized protein isoform X1 n=1 Tax=Palaemon carinicauda TaxID=392227 RepID=UPI0035B60284